MSPKQQKVVNKLIFYSTPAYGHITAVLNLMHAYVTNGYQVYFYGTKEFQSAIEKTGAKYREYKFDSSKLDMTIGSQLFVLENTILQYTLEIAEGLIREAREIAPNLIMHDNVAMWGRIVSKELGVKACTINTFPTIPGILSQGMLEYVKKFSGILWRDLNTFPSLLCCRMHIYQRYPKIRNSMLANTLNQEEYNICTFPKYLQPGFAKMKDYYFLGAGGLAIDSYFGEQGISILQEDRFEEWNKHRDSEKQKLIFVSLGTVFHNNLMLWKNVIQQFAKTKHLVVISTSQKVIDKLKIQIEMPNNILMFSFVKQYELLSKADLFISAGGMNSVCQALHFGVPCLLYPQQGEQRITSERLVRMGLGKMLVSPENICEEAEKLIYSDFPRRRALRIFKSPDYEAAIRWTNHIIQ